MSDAPNRHEAAYLAKVVRVGCVVCRAKFDMWTEPEIHHPRTDEGGAQRAQHWLAIPLCKEHHRGDTGFHGLGQGDFYLRYRLSEWDMLALTIEWVQRGFDRF
jgi:hypothetical protein